MRSACSSDWQKEMAVEIESLEKMAPLRLCQSLQDKRCYTKNGYIKPRVMLRLALAIQGELATCGNEQSHGADYNMTFSAVISMTTAKIVLALSRL